jgi:6-phosphogluconolactonase
VVTYRYDPERGILLPVQVIPSAPADFTGDNTGAEIAVAASGNFVYASNRGHNSIGIFAIDPRSETLVSVGWESTEGETPRFFALDPSGHFLYAANQDTDTIVTFQVDRAAGTLPRTGQIVKVGSPVTIVVARRL